MTAYSQIFQHCETLLCEIISSPEARASNLEICLPGLPYRQFWYPQVENTLGQLFSVGASQSRIAKQVKPLIFLICQSWLCKNISDNHNLRLQIFHLFSSLVH